MAPLMSTHGRPNGAITERRSPPGSSVLPRGPTPLTIPRSPEPWPTSSSHGNSLTSRPIHPPSPMPAGGSARFSSPSTGTHSRATLDPTPLDIRWAHARSPPTTGESMEDPHLELIRRSAVLGLLQHDDRLIHTWLDQEPLHRPRRAQTNLCPDQTRRPGRDRVHARHGSDPGRRRVGLRLQTTSARSHPPHHRTHRTE